MTEIKVHPAAALKFFAPFWIITLIPLLLRTVFGAEGNALAAFEAATLILLVLQGVLRARAVRIILREDSLVLQKGVVFKSETVISKKNVSCLSFRSDPALFLLSAVFVRLDTEAGRKEVSEFGALLRRRDAERLRNALGLYEGAKSLKMGARRITLMTAAISSAAIGVLVAVPIINRVGRVLDVGVAEILLDTVKKGTISSAFTLLSLIFLFFYAVSFIFLLIKNVSMQIGLTGDTVYVGAGLLPRRKTYFKKRDVNNIIIEQRPIMRLSRRYIIKVGVAGYGGRRGEGAVVVPAASGAEVAPFLRNIFSAERPKGGIRPEKTSKYRFVRWYLLLFAAAPAAVWFSGVRFSALKPITAPLSVVALAVCAYLLNLAFYCYRNTCLSDGGEFVFARSTRGFSAREMFCRRDRVGMFKLRRYAADKRHGSCILTVMTRSEGGEKIKAKYINYAAAREYCLAFWKKQQ